MTVVFALLGLFMLPATVTQSLGMGAVVVVIVVVPAAVVVVRPGDAWREGVLESSRGIGREEQPDDQQTDQQTSIHHVPPTPAGATQERDASCVRDDSSSWMGDGRPRPGAQRAAPVRDGAPTQWYSRPASMAASGS